MPSRGRFQPGSFQEKSRPNAICGKATMETLYPEEKPDAPYMEVRLVYSKIPLDTVKDIV
jgi:hypothetical protein